MENKNKIYRVIDANINRLSEGLRVSEEYFRFIKNEEGPSLKLKNLRHKVKDLANCFGENVLLAARDSINDPFNSGNTEAEGERKSEGNLLKANIKRAQEAARVIEEFSKLFTSENVQNTQNASELAKNIRFELYTFEKENAGAKN